MIPSLRELVLGKPVFMPVRAKTTERERKNWWKRPGSSASVPTPDGRLMVHVKFLFGIAPGWKLVLHRHEQPEPPDMHNHGGRLISIILRGGYIEERRNGVCGKTFFRTHRPGGINYVPLGTFHRIHALPEGSALTLCLIFPNVQESGMFTKDGWVTIGRYYAAGYDRKQASSRSGVGTA